MRLILREYLALLRESGEIDVLLPDLLLAMGVRPINRPGSGVRQFGVDVPAVGADSESSAHERKLYLITAKRGDITRDGWNSGKDAVRQSLDDILDSYLAQSVAPEHEGLPVKVIVATGGDMRQEVQASWDGYKKRYHGKEAHGHRIELEFWGGDVLSDLLDRYLVDEYLFPEEARAVMRRTLALVGEADADLTPFEALVDRTVLALPTEKTTSAQDARLRALRFLRLAVRTIHRWAANAENTRPALLAAEFVLLRTWGFLAAYGLTHPKRHETRELLLLLEVWREAAVAYFQAILPTCLVKDALFGYSPAEAAEYPLRTFDILGHLAIFGLDEVYSAANASGDRQQAHLRNARQIADAVTATIVNNAAAFHPPYDENAIEVALVMVLLALTGRAQDAEAYASQMVGRIAAAQSFGVSGIPLYRTSYDDLTDLALGIKSPEMDSSTLLPLLAEIALALGSADLYDGVRQTAAGPFRRTNFQTWYPDAQTAKALYDGPASDTGHMLTSIELPEDLMDFSRQILDVPFDKELPPYSADAFGLPILSLLASRRFRTPIRPSFWRQWIPDPPMLC